MTNPKDLVGARKAPVSLVPRALNIAAAQAMQVGADKYGSYNWRDYDVQMMTYLEAIERHLSAYMDGQDLDPETGVSHLAHAAAGLAILLDAVNGGFVIDNRPPKGPAAKMLAEQNRTETPVAVVDNQRTSDYYHAVYGPNHFARTIGAVHGVPAPEDELPFVDEQAYSPYERT